MRLSMWILADWLKKYNPQTRIQDGKCVLRNARLFSEGVRLDSADVFIGSMKEFSFEDNDRVICVQGHDMMLLETKDGDEILNEILDAFDYYNFWSDTLRARVREGASLQDLLQESGQVLDYPILVCDPGYFVTASYGMDKIDFESDTANENLTEMRKNGILPMKTILAINDDERIRVNSRKAYVMDYEELGSPCICRNIYSQNRHVGWLLMILQHEDITRGLMQLLDELGDIMEYWSDLNSRREELLSYNDVFQQILLESDTDQQKQSTRLRSIGWYPEDPKQIIALDAIEGSRLGMEFYRRKLERLGNGCFTVSTSDGMALVINRRIIDYEDFLEKLKEFMEQTNSWCGISPEFCNIFEMKEPLAMASSAARLGDHLVGSVTDFEDCALFYALEILKENTSSYILHPAIEILRKYDRKNHTDLANTLRVFLDCERNYIQSAGQLFIHRNTLLYRLKRIRELTGLDLDSKNVRLHLQLSFLLSDSGC